MRAVLGLSKTSTSLGWVLVDAGDLAREPLEQDVFCLDGGEPTTARTTDLARAARRVRDVVTSSGHSVVGVRVTCCDDSTGGEIPLRKVLSQHGFDDVATVPPAQATQAWAKVVARAMGHDKTAVCILERGAVSLSVIDTRNGAVQTDTTRTRDSAGLTDWLATVFNRDSRPPESLLLIGSRSDVEEAVGLLDDGLPVPVDGSLDALLALARGAALSSMRSAGTPAARHEARRPHHRGTGTAAAAIAVIAIVALSSASGPTGTVTGEPSRPVVAPSTGAAGTLDDPQPGSPLVLTAPPVEAKAAPVEPPARAEAVVTPPAPETPSVPIPRAVTSSAPGTVTATPEPVPHLPDAQPVQHLPEGQPGASPAVGPGVAAPGAPSSDPLAPQQQPVPPPPQDPVGQPVSPLFISLP